jgi:hypothetical protein
MRRGPLEHVGAPAHLRTNTNNLSQPTNTSATAHIQGNP